MKIASILAIAALALVSVSCSEQPIGHLTVPLYKSDLEKFQVEQAQAAEQK